MSGGHTAGPWEYDGDDGYGDLAGHRIRTMSEPEYILAVTIADVAQLADESEANAHLIAAAPTLLEALTRLVASADHTADDKNTGAMDEAIDQARAAIALATRNPTHKDERDG